MQVFFSILVQKEYDKSIIQTLSVTLQLVPLNLKTQWHLEIHNSLNIKELFKPLPTEN